MLIFYRHKAVDEYVFLCLTLVIRALKEKIESEIKTLLPILLSTGLSKGIALVHSIINKNCTLVCFSLLRKYS